MRAVLSKSWRVASYDHRGADETRVLVEEITAEALLAGLRQMPVPTLVIQGEKDRFAATASMEYLASLIPNSWLEVFKGSGHLPAMIRPLEVAAAMSSFFALSHGGTGSRTSVC